MGKSFIGSIVGSRGSGKAKPLISCFTVTSSIVLIRITYSPPHHSATTRNMTYWRKGITGTSKLRALDHRLVVHICQLIRTVWLAR